MSSQEAEVRELFFQSLEESVTPVLAGAGFLRSERSYKYVKETGELKLVVDTRPSFRPQDRAAMAHVYPSFHVYSAEARAVYCVLQPIQSPNRDKSPLFSSTLEHLSTVLDKRASRYVYQMEDLGAVLRDLGEYCRDYVVPLASRLESLDDAIELRSEYELLFDRVSLAAIAVLKGDPNLAYSLLDEAYPNDEEVRMRELGHIYRNIEVYFAEAERGSSHLQS